jgi:hypothetical protein
MKKAFGLLLTILCMWSCSDKTENQTETKNTYTLVFFDKTQSVNPNDEFVKNKYSSAIRELVDKNINTEGDILEVYYIHENTSKARALSIKSRTAKEDTQGMSPTDLEAANNAYDLSIKKERQIIYNALMQKLMESNTSASNSETNISATVPVISTAFDTYGKVKAFFFSDMVESLKAGRDFHRMAPISHNQAETWAKEDSKKYSAYNLMNADVSIILPFSPNTSSKVNNPNVTDYWRIFFEELGARKVNEL